MLELLEFDDTKAATYRKVAEVAAFPVDRELEFTLGGGQTQVIRPGGWVVLDADGRAHGVDGKVFADTYVRVGPQRFRKTATVRAYCVPRPFTLETTLQDGFAESSLSEFPAGSWAVRNPGGEVYVIDADVFPRLYERVDSTSMPVPLAANEVNVGLLERLTRQGPKRILALDGGGVRGAVTLGILARLEAELRSSCGRPDAVLADHFDLIGGTSTGAIIAAALARSRSVAYITKMYTALAGKVFGKKKPMGGILWDRYDHAALEAALKDEFGDLTIGDAAFRTGLCIVTKRVDTASTWPILNHPGGAYYAHNSALRVVDVLRASTAAPTYFAPQHLAETHWRGVFADGGVSMHNNPALQLFLVATLQGFPFRWMPRARLLTLVSVGTGYWEKSFRVPTSPKPAFWAKTVPALLMADAESLVETVMLYLSQSHGARSMDGEIGNLSNDLLGDIEHLRYIRFDPLLDLGAFHDVGEHLHASELEDARDLAAAARIHALLRIGEKYAVDHVDAQIIEQ